jgi:hypothetical protein
VRDNLAANVADLDATNLGAEVLILCRYVVHARSSRTIKATAVQRSAWTTALVLYTTPEHTRATVDDNATTWTWSRCLVFKNVLMLLL